MNNHNYQDFKYDWFKIRDIEYLKHQAEVEARKIRNEHVIKGKTFDKPAYLNTHSHYLGIEQGSWLMLKHRERNDKAYQRGKHRAYNIPYADKDDANNLLKQLKKENEEKE